MGSGPTILRRARAGSSALDLDTEAGRAFLQERLALYRWRSRRRGTDGGIE